MDKLLTRPRLIGALLGVLSLYAFTLLLENASLKKNNQNLLQQSVQLQQTLDHLQKDQRGAVKSAGTFKDHIARLRKENHSLMVAIKKNNDAIASVKEEKTYLEEMLINKTKQIEILNNQKGAAVTIANAPEGSTENINDALAEKDEELKRLSEQNRILQDKLDRLYKTTSTKINEINIAKIALEETVSTAKQKIEDEWNTVNLGSVTAGSGDESVNKNQDKKQQPKSEGHVLAINNEHGFVVVDLGKVDNLTSSATLEVKKNGVSIATLSVLEIRDVMAACNIKDVQSGRTIEINDPVSVLR